MANNDPFLLHDKVAFITGGASGIGAASATALADAGAKIIVCDRADEPGEKLVSELCAAGADAAYCHADVTSESEIANAIDATMTRFGRLDCAVNSAGVNHLGTRYRIGELPTDTFDTILAINLRGVFLSVREEIRAMTRGDGGSIVNIASGAGLVGLATSPAYVSSKHGVVGLSKAAALDHAADGIRVNALCPGVVDTPMTAPSVEPNPELLRGVESRVPAGRVGSAMEIAHAVVWLCSPLASYTTGIAMPVDGGYVAQ